jgi:hypothetical protein
MADDNKRKYLSGDYDDYGDIYSDYDPSSFNFDLLQGLGGLDYAGGEFAYKDLDFAGNVLNDPELFAAFAEANPEDAALLRDLMGGDYGFDSVGGGSSADAASGVYDPNDQSAAETARLQRQAGNEGDGSLKATGVPVGDPNDPMGTKKLNQISGDTTTDKKGILGTDITAKDAAKYAAMLAMAKLAYDDAQKAREEARGWSAPGGNAKQAVRSPGGGVKFKKAASGGIMSLQSGGDVQAPPSPDSLYKPTEEEQAAIDAVRSGQYKQRQLDTYNKVQEKIGDAYSTYQMEQYNRAYPKSESSVAQEAPVNTSAPVSSPLSDTDWYSKMGNQNVYRDPTSGYGIGLASPKDSGDMLLAYYDPQGNRLRKSVFNAEDLYKNADEFGIDLKGIGALGQQLDAAGINYKPGQFRPGTGSNRGINFADVAAGKLGSAYDWTQDPFAAQKGPGALERLAASQALAERLKLDPTESENLATFLPQGRASGGGIGSLEMARGGRALPPRYLDGHSDGMADKVPAHIDGKRPAALSDGEFVIPADVVSHLGNGNSNAGAKRLYEMMDRIRAARTGNRKQGKQINPDKFMPR